MQGREIEESFCIDPSGEESYLVNMVKQLCREKQLSPQCERPLYNIIKEQIRIFKETSGQLESSEVEEAIETIRLDFQLGKICIKDQFLWNVSDPDANPECFSEVMCKDLELPRTFVPEIACRIREQIIEYRVNTRKGKSQKMSGNNLKKNLVDKVHERLADSFGENDSQPRSIYSLPSVRKRNEWDEWSPHVQELSEAEAQKLEVRNHKKTRLTIGLSSKLDDTPEVPGSRDLDPQLSYEGENTPKQQPSRPRASQAPLHDGTQHAALEAHPPCLAPGGPMVQPLPVHHAHHSASLSRARSPANYPTYAGNIQTSLTGQWAPQSSMGRLSVHGSPRPHSSGFVDRYMQMEALQAQQSDAMSQGNMGTLMGSQYQNTGLVPHFQNGHQQVQPPANARGWVINQPYDNMYR